jgi:hypothetical protein
MFGRELKIPIDSVIDTDALLGKTFESEKQYAEHLEQTLTKAFTIARDAQIAATRKNEARRKLNPLPPNFQPGDKLWYWAYEAESQRARNERGEKVKLREKWADWWLGPFEMIRWDGPKYCWITQKEGKELKAHVNRLSFKPEWSDDSPDTADWVNEILTKEKSE